MTSTPSAALMQEGEREVLRPDSCAAYSGQAAAGGVGHLLHGQALIIAQRADLFATS